MNDEFDRYLKIVSLNADIFNTHFVEMPGIEIVSKAVKSLIAVSNMNGCELEGYIIFVTGKYQDNDAEEDDNTDDIDHENEELTYSKEAKISELYCWNIYHPLAIE